MTKNDIQQFIDKEINPLIASHGGYISIHNFNEESKELKITMGGGCQGCASSKMTLRLGVENHLREEFPSIGDIEDVTDHLSGENPYYEKE